MGGAKRSRTAQGVAAERALLSSLGAVDDPFASAMLTPAMRSIVWALEHGPRRVPDRSVTLAGLAARVRWFDVQVARALDDAITQVVIVGAGYDSRAWRLRRDGVRFFELDHEATQRDKRRRRPVPGPVYVECDLRADDAAEVLVDHGLSASHRSLYVVEGVSMYLSERDVRRQLALLAELSAVGSRLAVDFYPPREAGTSLDRRQLWLQRLARRGSGESFRLSVERPQAVELVRAAGWEVDEALSLRDAGRALVPTESGLRVEEINEHKSLLAAVRT